VGHYGTCLNICHVWLGLKAWLLLADVGYDGTPLDSCYVWFGKKAWLLLAGVGPDGTPLDSCYVWFGLKAWLLLAGVGPDGTCLDSCQADLSAFYAQTGSLVFQQHAKEYLKKHLIIRQQNTLKSTENNICLRKTRTFLLKRACQRLPKHLCR
jgi:hypothetical protein